VRTYEKTHPWITFKLDLRRAAPAFWMLLGEARSKCEHIANVPLRPATAEQLHLLYLAKGALATTAIEGNTLSEDEVVRHLEGKLRLPPSKEYLTREIDNEEPVSFGKLREVSPRVAAAYATKTAKTLSRDLSALIEMDLLELTPTGYRAKKETILAFLPLRRSPSQHSDEA
jgi:hypothetical protein